MLSASRKPRPLPTYTFDWPSDASGRGALHEIIRLSELPASAHSNSRRPTIANMGRILTMRLFGHIVDDSRDPEGGFVVDLEGLAVTVTSPIGEQDDDCIVVLTRSDFHDFYVAPIGMSEPEGEIYRVLRGFPHHLGPSDATTAARASLTKKAR